MATRLIALLVLALSFLPVANLIPGGESDPEYAARLLDWAYGFALCGGIGGLVAYLAHIRRRGMSAALGDASPGEPLPELATPRAVVSADSSAASAAAGFAGFGFLLGAALLSLLLFSVIAHLVFSARPLLIDEIVQVLQARWYAQGMLAVPVPPLREFFSILHLVDLGDIVYSQFPAGGPAMLALGSLVGAEWIVGPVAGAASVVLFGLLLRRLEPEASRRWHRGAVALFALAPFGAFMFGSHMNHVTTLAWLLLAAVALARATERTDAHPGWGLLTGLALGAAATIRPLDGAAFALPAAAWLAWLAWHAWHARRSQAGLRPLAGFLLSGVGVALPMSALFWVNWRTTGNPTLFGYDLLWGNGHALGFHMSPWGPIHTPARGIELVSLNFTRLSVYLFETPFPALLPATAALWYGRALRPMDRYLLVASAFVVAGYWAYWHDGFYLGPRFMLPLLPVLVLWSARLPLALSGRVRRGSSLAHALVATCVAGVAYALVSIAVVRVPQYRNGMTSMRVDVAAAARAAGVQDALVLVKESWGAQLVVRMWEAGITRSDTEVLYRNADACKLELTLDGIERDGVHGAAARARLEPLRADSSALIKSTRSPDFTERMLPNATYPPVC
ncbi:MAG: hypothetical protein OEW77_02845, partial [Gemmatimonadota bacterium]|nr:hypothetical protein [Gemmatimonadota bacterium]